MRTAENNLLPIAQVLKSYGTQGELNVSFHGLSPLDIDINEPVFIYFDELPVPFFITSLIQKGKTKANIKIEGIDTLNEAEALLGLKLHLDASSVQIEEDVDEDLSEALKLLNFILVDQNNNAIGAIDGAQNYSGNICLEVGEHLIPFHSELVIKINNRKKTVVLNIPEGLF